MTEGYEHGLSNKVKKLIQILHQASVNKGPLPKVIIFVKDRVVAAYLHKILVGMGEAAKLPHNENNSKLLFQGYVVAVAMSPKGKNLLNKAYSSFKHN